MLVKLKRFWVPRTETGGYETAAFDLEGTIIAVEWPIDPRYGGSDAVQVTVMIEEDDVPRD